MQIGRVKYTDASHTSVYLFNFGGVYGLVSARPRGRFASIVLRCGAEPVCDCCEGVDQGDAALGEGGVVDEVIALAPARIGEADPRVAASLVTTPPNMGHASWLHIARRDSAAEMEPVVSACLPRSCNTQVNVAASALNPRPNVCCLASLRFGGTREWGNVFKRRHDCG